jgi:hypothetical protein
MPSQNSNGGRGGPWGSGTERDLNMGQLVPIQKGRKLVEKEIFSAAAEKVQVFGIELLDIRFKRISRLGFCRARWNIGFMTMPDRNTKRVSSSQ